jgi:hypothetical protein
MNIALVGNKQVNLRNNSKLIDSCDLVVRVNKMCNLDTGLTGKRTDWLFNVINPHYWTCSFERRHGFLIPQIPKVWVNGYWYKMASIRAKQEMQAWNFEFIPGYVFVDTGRWTTAAHCLKFVHMTFPEAHIYFAGQASPTTWRRERHEGTWHTGSEMPFYRRLEREGIVEFLDGEDV